MKFVLTEFWWFWTILAVAFMAIYIDERKEVSDEYHTGTRKRNRKRKKIIQVLPKHGRRN